jgi:hypothetical protein
MWLRSRLKEGRRGSVNFVVIGTTSLDIALRQYAVVARAWATLHWTAIRQGNKGC